MHKIVVQQTRNRPATCSSNKHSSMGVGFIAADRAAEDGVVDADAGSGSESAAAEGIADGTNAGDFPIRGAARAFACASRASRSARFRSFTCTSDSHISGWRLSHGVCDGWRGQPAVGRRGGGEGIHD